MYKIVGYNGNIISKKGTIKEILKEKERLVKKVLDRCGYPCFSIEGETAEEQKKLIDYMNSL